MARADAEWGDLRGLLRASSLTATRLGVGGKE